MKILLLGMKGVGKTTFGKKLADVLNLDFFDTDQIIETKMNAKVSDIYFQNGEKYFRNLENSVLLDLSKKTSGVFSVGGGTFLTLENRLLLREFSLRVCLYLKKEDLLLRWKSFSSVCSKHSKFDDYFEKRLKALQTLPLTWLDANSPRLLNIMLEIFYGK
jgi:shikimate kinase